LAFSDQGMFDKAQDHLRASLTLLGVEVPVTINKMKLKYKVSKGI
jgi:hypothetical protein